MDMTPKLIIGLDICRKQGIKLDHNRLEIARRGICLIDIEVPQGVAKQRLEETLIKWEQKDKKQVEQKGKKEEKAVKPLKEKPSSQKQKKEPQAMATLMEEDKAKEKILKVGRGVSSL